MPRDDKYMKYNYNFHRYELTDDAVLDLIGENLNDLTDGNIIVKNKLLRDVSDDVYGYIYEDSRSSEYLEMILAKDDNLRPIVQTMLIAQFEYMLFNGRLTLYSGVNIAKQSALDTHKIRNEVKVAETVVQETHRILPRYGICLKYAGNLPRVSPSQRYKGY